MFLYWLMFVTPVMSGMASLRYDKFTRQAATFLAALLLILIIGGRDVVGCDWDAYLGHFYNLQNTTLMEALEQNYPGYAFLNWVAMQLGSGLHGVNFACGTIFAVGLIAFCRRQPRPWLTLAAAVPYLVVVVAMGFTRQATAIGLLMLAFNAFTDRKLVRFLIFVALAALFHSSAVVWAPLAVLIRRDRPLSPLVIGGGGAALLGLLILSNSIDYYVYGYIEQEYPGEGALYRMPLNAMAGLAVLMFRRRWLAQFADGRFYIILSIGTLAVLPVAFILPVMADRMSMYLLPFQVAVAARLPDLVPRRYRTLTTVGVVLLYATSLYVWLNFAHHANCWVPYSSILI